MTQLEKRIGTALLTLIYEPGILEGSRPIGDYGGFNVERRFVIKTQDAVDPFDQGIELFTTNINSETYLGIYRTWEFDGENSEGGAIDAMIRLNLKNEFPVQRISEFERLTDWVNAIVAYWENKKHGA